MVIAGCDALQNSVLADAFVSRGVSSVVGWSGLISSDDNDRKTLEFLESVLVHDFEIDEAVDLVMEGFENSNDQNSRFLHYSGKV